MGHSKLKVDEEFDLAMQGKDSWLACLHCIKKSGETRWEIQLLLSLCTEQHLRTGRPFRDAYSSDYSEWNIDEKWSSQVWKPGEMLGTSTWRPVDDKFDIDNDMDYDVVTESKLVRAVTKWTQSLWQTNDSFDFLHSSRKWLLTILSCV